MYVFSALALLNWLSGRKGIRPVKTEWWGTCMVPAWSEVQTCIWPSWCHCHSLSLASVKSSLVLPFWYRPTRVVPDKGPLNGCVWITGNVKIGTKKCLETTQGRHSIRYLIEHFLRINSDGNSVNVRRWPREWRLRPVSLSGRERGVRANAAHAAWMWGAAIQSVSDHWILAAHQWKQRIERQSRTAL